MKLICSNEIDKSFQFTQFQQGNESYFRGQLIGLDNLAGLKALDPNHCRQRTL